MALFSDDDSFEDENMAVQEMDNDDDSDFELASATTKRGKKASPAAPPAKKKKPLKNVENVIEDEDDEDDQEATAKEPTPKKKTTASSQYQKLSQLEHVLKRPDTYVGSTELNESKLWVFDPEQERMVYRDVKIVPGLYKIFDEILVNAADNKIRDADMNMLKVTIDREKNVISVYNNGRGIPIEMHDKENMWIPQLIFGNLLTSSNYDDDEKKVTGGRNGFGAKLCNIFSKKFTVETANKKQKYVQTWTDNMGKCTKPKITELKKGEEYTKITFEPDLSKFNMTELDNDMIGVLYRRVYDLAGSTSKVKVYLNGTLLKISSFKQYVEMFVKALQEQANPGTDEEDRPKPTIVHERINDRWEVAFGVSDGNSFNQVSFVNSIATTSGGTHINYLADQLATKIADHVKKKNKSAPIRPAQIKNNMFLFVNCLIENPAFTSQTKEQLTTKVSAFGSKCQLSENFLGKVLKTTIVENVMDVATANADKELKKTDGGKKKRITGYAKLDDANKAGTADGHKCTLILTEGDSAKSLAVAGLAVVGRDYYGVFPLRGKLLNVREASHDQITKNAEIQAIKQIMGLQHKKRYDTVKGLRYGHIMIMTDQDHDGSHIKGLIINFLETSFPGLLDLAGFLVEFITPIVKVSVYRGKTIVKKIPFYTEPQYETWRETEGKTCVWKHKYYKGLGTSDPNVEGREYFQQLDKHLKTFLTLQDGDKELIELAFSKKKADARKDWLRQFKPGTHLDPDLSEIPIGDFINKELILFSMADNMRSIPSVLDGFKPTQRKIMYGCFMKNLVSEIKVAQLTGYIAEKSGYHHGETSLSSTIVGLAQDFVGSNNLNYLMPNGAFGTRATGGKDAAAPRYIHTEMNTLTRKLFNANDDPLLTYLQDDENTVEPEWYLPIIPTLLVNGSDGIGTGWSTTVPPYNPVDLVDNIKRLMVGLEPQPMCPWYKGWTGTIERLSDDKFRLSGRIEKVDSNTVVITELPAKMWTQNMKEFLLEAIVKDKRDKSDKGWIEDMVEQHGTDIKFVVKMTQSQMADAEKEGLLSKFKLQSTVSTANMMAFDPQGRIQKYASPEDILKEFYLIRLTYYQKRKDYLADKMQNKLEKLTQQARFVKMIVEKELTVSNKKKVDLTDELISHNFPKFAKDGKPVYEAAQEEAGDETLHELEELAEQDEEAAEIQRDSTVKKPDPPSFDYLLGMSLWQLTRERYEKLLKDKGNMEAELVEFLKKSAKDIWTEELDDFLKAWEVYLEEDQARRDGVAMGNKRAKAKAKSKGRKVKDEDDDFVPGAKKKAAPKKKKKDDPDISIEVAPRPTSQTTLDYKIDSNLKQPEFPAAKKKIKKEKDGGSARSSESAEPEAVKKQGSKSTTPEPAEPEPEAKKVFGKGVSTLFGSPSQSKKKDDFDMDPDDLYNDLVGSNDVATSSAKKPSAPPAKPKGKSVFDDLSDGDPFSSDGEFKKPANPKKANAPAKKPAPPKKAPVKKPAAKSSLFVGEDDDEDSDVDMEDPEPEPEPKPKAKPAAKRAVSKKGAKKAEGEDGDEDEAVKKSTRKKLPAKTTTVKKAAPAKKSKKVDSDDDDGDIEDGEEKAPAPAPRASRRAASVPKKTYTYSVVSDEDYDEPTAFGEDDDDDDEFDEFDD